jgi:signal transduction histidine kinase
LALTRKLVEFQHGQISVQSAPGLGSTFTVVLPLHEMQEAAAST